MLRNVLRRSKDFHRVLGVRRDADKADVRKAYLELAKKLHPDVNPHPEASARFKEVSEAFEVLNDDAKRAELSATDFDESVARAPPRGGYTSGRNRHESDERRARAKDFNRSMSWIDYLMHPSTLILLLPSLFFIYVVLSPAAKPQVGGQDTLVQAWFNPNSQRWEAPAPWNDTYRSLAPELTMVPRKIVQQPSDIES